MNKFFVAGNLWLLIALVVLLGRNVERHDPTRYSFIGYGWWDPMTYNLIVILLFIFGLFLLRKGWKTT